MTTTTSTKAATAKTTTASKKPAAASATKTDTKPTTAEPTPAPVEKPARPATRTELLATLKANGYTGPTSFIASTLRDVVAWMEAGSPKDTGSIPNGILFAVHPDLKPAAKTAAKRLTKIDQAVLAALIEVQTVLQDDGSSKAVEYLSNRIAGFSAASSLSTSA